MFARLRGVPERQLRHDVDELMTRLLLKDYRDKLAGNLRSVRTLINWRAISGQCVH